MNNFVQEGPNLAFAVAVYFAVGACLVAWAAIFERWLSGKPVLPYQSRRQVPWRIWDLLAILLFYFAGLIVVFYLANICLPDLNRDSSFRFGSHQPSAEHPIARLLMVKDWNILLLCCILGVVVAPIAEEMFFRVLLQGWLEKANRHWRRRLPLLRRWIPMAVMPIFLSSLVFAGPHFRKAAPLEDVQYISFLLAGHGVLNLLSLIFGVAWVRWCAGATTVDLGWAPEKFFADVRLGLLTFVAIAVPIYGSKILLSQLVPKQYTADPIPIFFLAIALGFLYQRTHRATPSIVVHLVLNATSLVMAWLGAG